MKRILSVLLALVMVLGMIPMVASAAETEVVFEFGAKGSATHADGNDLGSSKTYTEGTYTLSLTSMSKVYGPAYDAKGNSCIKLGTSSAAGKFSFTVPSDVTAVVILIAKYKTNTTKVNVNGTAYTLTKNSNNGEYDEITVDTSNSKAVSVTTVSGGYRAMVNTIKFICAAKDCEHTNAETVNAVDATCTSVGYTAGKYCPDCKTYIEGHEEIAKIAHTYVDGYCSCGEEQPAIYVKKNIDEITDGQKVIITMQKGNDSWALSSANGTNSAPTAVKVTVANDAIETNVKDIYWNISNDNGQLMIYPAGNSATWLYCFNDNNGVRVGTGDAKHFVIDGNYLKITETTETRYVGVYNSADWRCYTNTTGNIAGQNLAFYVKECTHSTTEEVTVEADCETAGSVTVSCADCGVVMSTSEIPAIGHNYVDGVCANCGNPDPDACQHTNKTTTTVDATCTTAGSVTVACADCHEVFSTDEIAPLGHNEVADAAVAATCTSTGLTAGSHCSVCNEVIVAQTVTDALGHSYVNGTCANCGEKEPNEATITFDNVTKRTEYSTSIQVWEENGIVVTNKKDASSTNVGNYSNPARFYKDSTVIIAYPGMTKIVINSEANTSEKNTYFDNLKNSLADENVTIDGTTITIEFSEPVNTYSFVCDGGQSRVYSVTVHGTAGICAHEFAEDAWTIVTPATCEAVGSKTGPCSKCGETVEKEIPALGHSYAYNAETNMMVCANCSDSFAINTITEAKAYTDKNKVYYFKGIVTNINGQNVFIEDDKDAVCVCFTNAASAAGIALGDELLVWDTMTHYNDLIETTFTTSSEVVVLSHNNEIPVKTLTIAEILADSTQDYLGENVIIKNVTIKAVTEWSEQYKNVTYTITDGTNDIQIYRAPAATADDVLPVGTMVNVNAVISIYNGTYQLSADSQTDLAKITVTITDISFAPGADALGFKAKVENADMTTVTEIGFEFSVNGVAKEFKVQNGVKEVFSARVMNILKNQGGEMEITGRAYAVINGEKVYGESVTTTMKETIIAVNDMNLTAEQQAAVYGLYDDYATVIAAWIEAAGKVNNIATWAPAA